MSQYWIHILVLGGITAVEAWGLGLVVRTGQLSVGHAALAGVGGYMAGYLVIHNHPSALAYLAAAAAGAVAAIILAAVTLRLNHLFLALATLVFGQIVEILAGDWSPIGGAEGLVGVPLMKVWPVVVVACTVVIVVEMLVIRGSRVEVLGRVLSADTTLVEMAGVRSALLRVGTFAVSGAVTGFAGALLAFNGGVVQPANLDFNQSLNLLVYVIVGGSTNGLGMLAAAFALTVLPAVAHLQGVDVTLVLGGVLVVVMLVRSDGLLPRFPLTVFKKAPQPTGSEDRSMSSGLSGLRASEEAKTASQGH